MIVSFNYGTLKDQESNRVFRALPAVRNGNYVALPTEVATACYQESTLSIRWAASRVADRATRLSAHCLKLALRRAQGTDAP